MWLHILSVSKLSKYLWNPEFDYYANKSQTSVHINTRHSLHFPFR